MVTTETSEKVAMVAFLVRHVDGWSREQASSWLHDINHDPNELSYDELVRPLRETGGEVCLQVEWENGNEIWYYTVRHVIEGDDILLLHHDGKVDAAHCEAESRLSQDSGHKLGTITPIRRENTPFEGFEFK